MTKELGIYKEFKSEAEQRLKELESMIQERDREISRLNNLYMTTENLDKLNIEFTEKANGETISKLNSQLDYLNKENNRLQRNIDELKVKNKGNTGMYYENRKVWDKLEKLKEENADLRRKSEKDQSELEGLKEKQGELISSIKLQHIEREKYENAIKTIQYQQQDIEKLKKFIEIKDNQKKIEASQAIASKQQDELDYEPEKEQINAADLIKIKHDKERLAKKNEQFRNEINAISGKYLGALRQFESLHQEYKELEKKVETLEGDKDKLREEVMLKEKEMNVMIEYLRNAQPMNNKENEEVNFKEAESPFKKPEKEVKKQADPEKTKKMHAF